LDEVKRDQYFWAENWAVTYFIGSNPAVRRELSCAIDWPEEKWGMFLG
jgi:hypothetical protein